MSISGENICPAYFSRRYGKSVVSGAALPQKSRLVNVPYTFMSPYRIDNRAYCPPVTDLGYSTCGVVSVCANSIGLTDWLSDGTFDEIDQVKVVEKLPREGLPSVYDVLSACVAVRGFGIGGRIYCVKSRMLDVKYAIHEFGAVVGCFGFSSEWYASVCGSSLISASSESTLTGLLAVALVCGYDGDGVWIQAPWGIDWGDFGISKIEWSTFNRQFRYGVVAG